MEINRNIPMGELGKIAEPSRPAPKPPAGPTGQTDKVAQPILKAPSRPAPKPPSDEASFHATLRLMGNSGESAVKADGTAMKTLPPRPDKPAPPPPAPASTSPAGGSGALLGQIQAGFKLNSANQTQAPKPEVKSDMEKGLEKKFGSLSKWIDNADNEKLMNELEKYEDKLSNTGQYKELKALIKDYTDFDVEEMGPKIKDLFEELSKQAPKQSPGNVLDKKVESPPPPPPSTPSPAAKKESDNVQNLLASIRKGTTLKKSPENTPTKPDTPTRPVTPTPEEEVLDRNTMSKALDKKSHLLDANNDEGGVTGGVNDDEWK